MENLDADDLIEQQQALAATFDEIIDAICDCDKCGLRYLGIYDRFRSPYLSDTINGLTHKDEQGVKRLTVAGNDNTSYDFYKAETVGFVFSFDIILKLEDLGYKVETAYIKSQEDKIYKCDIVTWE